MHLFFQPDLTSDQLWLSEEESKHCVRVLRLQKGDSVYLADGKGTEAKAVIIEDNPKKCLLTIESRTNHQNTSKVYLHILVAPTKNMERMEWFIEKATEVGVSEITFLETTNSERTKINLERCNKVAISAMKQSKQWVLPQINEVRKLTHYLNALDTPINELRFVAWCGQEQLQTLPVYLEKQKPFKQTPITILIGPEGDFTETEIILAKQVHFQLVSFGASILRTETAALYACMAIKTITSLYP